MNSRDNDVIIKLSNVSKTFKFRENSGETIRHRVFNIFTRSKIKKFQALENINLEIHRGEFFGIIGHNGSGKSTLLNIIMKSIVPDKGGHVFTKGKIIRLALGIGFDPGLSARENIYVNASILGLTFKEIGRRFDSIVDFAGLNEFVDTPIKYYSSGMRSRLSFAVAVHADADIILIDEFFGGVGDESFKMKSQKVFEESIVAGRTIVHVNHSMSIIKQYCNRVAVLHKGKLKGIGEPDQMIDLYKECLTDK